MIESPVAVIEFPGRGTANVDVKPKYSIISSGIVIVEATDPCDQICAAIEDARKTVATMGHIEKI